MPRIGRSFPIQRPPTRGPLSSLNFVPRISPNRGGRARRRTMPGHIIEGAFLPAAAIVANRRRLKLGVGL